MDRNGSLEVLALAASLRHQGIDVRTIEYVTPLQPAAGRCHNCGRPCRFIVASFCDDCLPALTADQPRSGSVTTP